MKLAAKREVVFHQRSLQRYHTFILKRARGENSSFPIFQTRFSVFEFLESFVFRVLALASAGIDKAVQRHDTNQAHICDCMHMQDAFLADSVRRRGGKITVWPHSANSAMPAFLAATPDYHKIFCASKFSKDQFGKFMPNTICEVIPEALFAHSMSREFSWDKTKPINVVLIGNAHALGRTPLMNIDLHRSTLRNFFIAANQSSQKIDVHVKPKEFWETKAWMSELLPAGLNVVSTNQVLGDLTLPNMVFLCVNNPSTAMLEGINWGIPCFVIQEVSIHGYVMPMPKDIVPQADVKTILGQICEMRDEEARQTFVRRQQAWFDSAVLEGKSRSV